MCCRGFDLTSTVDVIELRMFTALWRRWRLTRTPVDYFEFRHRKKAEFGMDVLYPVLHKGCFNTICSSEKSVLETEIFFKNRLKYGICAQMGTISSLLGCFLLTVDNQRLVQKSHPNFIKTVANL